MTKGSKRPPPPGPTQVLRPPLVIDPDVVRMQRELDRKAGAEKVHLNAQFPDKVMAAIGDRPDVSHNELARWLQADPVMKKLVVRPDGEAMKPRSLAKKIARYRRQK
jgi:hypothetical protein